MRPANRSPLANNAFLAEFEEDLGRPTFVLLAGKREGLTQTIAARTEVDPWLAHMLLAEHHLDEAWQGRGKGYADSVTDEGWKIFRGWY